MSETDTEHDTADAEPTPGPVDRGVTSAEQRRIATVFEAGEPFEDIIAERPVRGQEVVANAKLMKACFNAANELPDEYDAVAAVEALPELIDALEAAYEDKPAPTL